jgi:CRISPR system Cascade subunit CasE
VSERVHLVRLSLQTPAVMALGKAQGLPLREADEGYLAHAALRALFGDLSPQPFAFEGEGGEGGGGRAWRLLGYSKGDKGSLVEHARAFADPLAFQACALEELVSKPMPEHFAEGTRLGFELRACPIVRKSSAGEKHRAGAEVDAFLARCWQAGDGVPIDRETVYIDWLRAQLGREGAASLENARLARFCRSHLLRRTQGDGRQAKRCERPDATLVGTLRVENAGAFAGLLARGVGRHKAFGFGMLLLRPPARSRLEARALCSKGASVSRALGCPTPTATACFGSGAVPSGCKTAPCTSLRPGPWKSDRAQGEDEGLDPGVRA